MPLRMWLLIKREVLRKGSREDIRSFLMVTLQSKRKHS